MEQLSVFLCHASGDKPSVRQLFDRLSRIDRVQPWLDEKCLIPGQDWELEIRRAVRESHVVVVCLSKSSINREGYVQKEIRHALDIADEKPEGVVFVIPARLEDCTVPSRLAKWQWVDLFISGGFERLCEALRVRASSLGLALAPNPGAIMYDSNTEEPFFASWTLYGPSGGLGSRIGVAAGPQEGVPVIEMRAFGPEPVGVNKSFRLLHGAVEFSYCADESQIDGENLYFAMIPMQETGIGRAGLIEVGSNVEDHPDNAWSPHRVRYFVPKGHVEDNLWHTVRLEFDFRGTPAAF